MPHNTQHCIIYLLNVHGGVVLPDRRQVPAGVRPRIVVLAKVVDVVQHRRGETRQPSLGLVRQAARRQSRPEGVDREGVLVLEPAFTERIARRLLLDRGQNLHVPGMRAEECGSMRHEEFSIGGPARVDSFGERHNDVGVVRWPEVAGRVRGHIVGKVGDPGHSGSSSENGEHGRRKEDKN